MSRVPKFYVVWYGFMFMRSVAENLFDVLSCPFEFWSPLPRPRPAALVSVFVLGREDYD